jgi:hypothetical protein
MNENPAFGKWKRRRMIMTKIIMKITDDYDDESKVLEDINIDEYLSNDDTLIINTSQ